MKRVLALAAALLFVPLLVRLLLAQSPAPPPSQAPPAPTFTLTDLGSLNGVSGIDQENVRRGPTALNADAQVAGFRLNLAFGDQPIGFLWDTGSFTDLGTGGGPQSWAYGINRAGQIVGASNFSASGQLSAFVWQSGTMANLDPTPNEGSFAYGVNAGGDVAGFISPAAAGVLPVIWKGGTVAGETILASLPCSLAACQGEALAINDLGQAAGVSVGGNVNVFRPVMWDVNGRPTELIPQPGDPGTSEANGINNSGVVIGYYQPQPSINNLLHAFRWQSGVFTDLGTLGTDTYSGAWGIDSKGDIVGTSATTFSPILGGDGGRAFLYIAATQTMYDLTTLVPGTSWRLNAGYAINDNGQIVGIGIAPDGRVHGFLLTPNITPTTTTLAPSNNPPVFGQQVSFTATVSPTTSSALTPTGNVTFSDGGAALGTVALSSGTAILSTSSLTVGTHTITASYGGDANFSASTSSGVNQVVRQAATSTALAASTNPAIFGQPVGLTATVTPVAPGSGTSTGTVTFFDGPTTLGVSALNPVGTAMLSTSSLTAGSHSVTASYGGDTNFSGSTGSLGVTVTVQGPPPPVQILDNETIHVADSQSFPDVFDAEVVKVSDTVTVTPLINVGAPVAEFSAGALGFTGQSGTQTITVSDIGKTSLALTAATISGSAQFAITQIACSNTATSFSTVLQSGGACVLTIGYTASAAPASDNATLVVTDNATLSNITSVPAGSSYTQSIPLSSSGSSTAPPPPPPAVIPIPISETIHVTDAESFPDVFDAEPVHVADRVFVTPLINVGAPVAEFSAGALGFSGQSGSQNITVSDIGKVSLTLSSANIFGSSQFAITQVSCTNSATSLSTDLSSGGVCALTIGYSASATPANDNATLVVADNAALSNITSVPAGSSYTQSIPLSGSSSSTAPPPPPPAVVPVPINESVHVTDSESLPDIVDPEQIRVTDQVSLIPCDFTVSATSPLNLSVGGLGSTPITIASVNGCNLQVSLSTSAAKSGVTVSLPGTATTGGTSTTATLTVTAGPSVTPSSFTVTVTATSGLTHSASVNVNVTASISGTMGVVQTLLNAGAITTAGVANALTSKLSAAQSATNAQTSINTVKAFQNQVQAQAGKSIATSFTLSGVTFNPANTLMTDGQGLINSYKIGMIPDPITGYVVNANAVGVAGATVTIIDATGNVIASGTTDITGFYFLATTGVLTPGANYTMRVSSLPSGFTTATPPTQSFTWQGAAVAFSNFVLN